MSHKSPPQYLCNRLFWHSLIDLKYLDTLTVLSHLLVLSPRQEPVIWRPCKASLIIRHFIFMTSYLLCTNNTHMHLFKIRVLSVLLSPSFSSSSKRVEDINVVFKNILGFKLFNRRQTACRSFSFFSNGFVLSCLASKYFFLCTQLLYLQHYYRLVWYQFCFYCH